MPDFVPLLKMTPHLTARPWGGERLVTQLNRGCSQSRPIGESWELSDHPDGPSRVDGGPFDGWLFGDVLRAYPHAMVGHDHAPQAYPLLVKYIDAASDLSIQVHPDDAYCTRHSLPDRGKTECWYIMDCPENADIIYGLAPGVTAESLRAAIASASPAAAMRRVAIQPGTFLFVPAGTVHAILAGTLLCEIQQSSNITYRLWDWNRQPARQLHIAESLDVITYDQSPPAPLCVEPPTSAVEQVVLTDNEYFRVEQIALQPGASLELSNIPGGSILNGVRGNLSVKSQPVSAANNLASPDPAGILTLAAGETVFWPGCISTISLSAGPDGGALLVSRSKEL